MLSIMGTGVCRAWRSRSLLMITLCRPANIIFAWFVTPCADACSASFGRGAVEAAEGCGAPLGFRLTASAAWASHSMRAQALRGDDATKSRYGMKEGLRTDARPLHDVLKGTE